MLKIDSVRFQIDKDYTVASALDKCKARIKEVKNAWTVGEIQELIENGMNVDIGSILALDVDVCCGNVYDEPVFWFHFKSFNGVWFYSGCCVTDLDGNVHSRVSDYNVYKPEH